MPRISAFAMMILCLSFPMVGYAINVGDTVDNYQERFAALNHAYAKSPNDVEVLYKMAKFYMDANNPMRNLPMAMDYIVRAETQHIDLLERDKIGDLTRLAKKDITLPTLRQTKQAVIEAAYSEVEYRTDMSGTELDAYQQAFGIDNNLVKRLRQRRIGQVYNDALRAATPDAYYHFITIYPGTAEAEQMELQLSQRIADIFADCHSPEQVDSVAAHFQLSPSVQREANRYRSHVAYTEACHTNTIQAYKDYLRHYPSSDENASVRDRLDALLELQYSGLHGAQEYANFIDSNIDNALSEKALTQLRRLVFEEHDALAAELYVERFSIDPHYNEVFNRLYSWHAIEGSGAPLKQFQQRYPQFPFKRVLDDDLDFAERADAVNLLEDFQEKDFPNYASHVRQLYGKRIAFVPLQRMLQEQLAHGQYKEALERVKDFDLCFDHVAHSEYLDLQRILSDPKSTHKPTLELSANYNIQNPSLNSIDGNLYFSRTQGSTRKICFAKREGKKWVPASEVAFSNATNDGMTLYGFFQRGKRMVLGKNGDIWFAERDGDQWRIVEIPPYPVNTDYIETDAYVLPDGSGILLASDRPYGLNCQPSGSYFHGDTALATDLYFIPFSQGRWGDPINLGLNINTPYCERYPLLSRNMRTLYFVSDGRGGLGYGDILVATRTNLSDWSHWSTPKNAGRLINTGFAEAGLSFGPSEKQLFYSSNANKGLHACYSVPTWHDPQPASLDYDIAVSGMEGYLYRVTVVDLATHEKIQVIHCDGRCSKLDLNVLRDGQYAVLADAGIYFVPALRFTPSTKPTPHLQGYTFPELVASDKPISLDVVQFSDTSTTLTPTALLQLEQLATFIQRHPQAVVELIVDVPGRDAEWAYSSSLRRGQALRQLLQAYGLPADRTIISAYGNVHLGSSGNPSVAVRFREQ